MYFCRVYQDDFLTPGSIPSFASSRKQIRHSPKSPIYARPRPHLKQRFVSRVLNFDFFKCLATTDVFAIPLKNYILINEFSEKLSQVDISFIFLKAKIILVP